MESQQETPPVGRSSLSHRRSSLIITVESVKWSPLRIPLRLADPNRALNHICHGRCQQYQLTDLLRRREKFANRPRKFRERTNVPRFPGCTFAEMRRSDWNWVENLAKTGCALDSECAHSFPYAHLLCVIADRDRTGGTAWSMGDAVQTPANRTRLNRCKP